MIVFYIFTGYIYFYILLIKLFYMSKGLLKWNNNIAAS
jgi:hypothetical protein